MFRVWWKRIRRDRYDAAYKASRLRRLERERRAATELGALRVFTHDDTGTLRQMRRTG